MQDNKNEIQQVLASVLAFLPTSAWLPVWLIFLEVDFTLVPPNVNPS